VAILAGIDEAGFGPLLGPLVVSGVAFRVPDDLINRCLWRALKGSCTNRAQRGGRKLPVADSKVLYRSRDGLSHLERSALVMLAARECRPGTWRGLLDVVAPGASVRLDQCSWYADADVSLPVGGSIGDVGTQGNALRRDLRGARCEFLGALVESLDVPAYNRLVTSTRNKAVVLLGQTLRIVDRIMKSFPSERIRFYVDRQGGRTHYREVLMTAVSGASLTIMEESESRSAYRLDVGAQRYEVDFSTEGESRHFPVALASIYSKYLRELYMHRFNEYWCGRVPGLTPTAGYYTDAQRWLREWEASPEAATIDRDQLVRRR